MHRLKFALSALVIVIFLTTLVSAQNLSGSLSGTLGPGNYNVVGACQVQSGQSLTIMPGTTFQFSGNYNWQIYGTLTAEGTENDLIVFTSSSNWGGLRFNSGSSASTLDWVLIENVYTYSNGGGIYIYNGGMTISNSIISECQAGSGGGIYVENSPNTVIDNCKIAYCTAGNGGGIFFNNTNGGEVINSSIKYNTSTST